MNFCSILLLFIILKINKTNGYHAVFASKIAEAAVDKHDWQILWQERDENGLDILSFHQEAPGIWLVTFRANPVSLRNLRKFDIKYRIIVNNMRRYLETIEQEVTKGPPAYVFGNVTFQNYLDLDLVLEYVESLPAYSKPYKYISSEPIGKSIQNRTISMLKIENTDVNDIMLVEAGMHGREWISIMTAIYLITELVKGASHPELENMNWFIIPCLNPDGYFYSRHMKGYTFHRKNLNLKDCRPKKNNCTTESCGVDLNRNFAFHDIKVGIHSNPCAENYGGRRSFSEPESQALQSVLKQYKDKIKMFISLHSYGPFILYPWSYKKQKCDGWKDLVKAAQEGVKAIKANKGTNYGIRNRGTELALIAGCVEDYAKYLGVKYSYSMELQPGGKEGFMPELKSIKRLCEQNFHGIVAMALHINRQSKGLRSRTVKGANEVKGASEVKGSQTLVKPNILYILFLYGALLN